MLCQFNQGLQLRGTKILISRRQLLDLASILIGSKRNDSQFVHHLQGLWEAISRGGSELGVQSSLRRSE
jgi:hypothetical protein